MAKCRVAQKNAPRLRLTTRRTREPRSTAAGAGIIRNTGNTSSSSQCWALKEISVDALPNGSFAIANYKSSRVIDDYGYPSGYRLIQNGSASAPWNYGEAWKFILAP
jgi:hypothetical protein